MCRAGNLGTLYSFSGLFLRPAFLGLTILRSELSSESRNDSLPKARPVRSWRQIFSASSSSVSDKNGSHSRSSYSSGATLTRLSSFQLRCALALLHFHANGSVTRISRTGFISMYLAAGRRYFFIHWKCRESPLPQMSRPLLSAVDHSGVSTVRFTSRSTQAALRFRYGNQIYEWASGNTPKYQLGILDTTQS